jgi:cobalt/nickel transport system permease protein
MRHSFLDRYREGSSLIHRLDPRLKLLATLAFVLATTTTPSRGWLAFVSLAALALSATVTAGIPLAEALKRSTIALPFAGMVALSLPFTQGGEAVWSWTVFNWPLTVTDEGVRLFVAVVVKAWLSVMFSGLLVATTPFPDLLKAMRSLRVPTVLTATISFMYRYLFVLTDEAMRLQTARAARSAGSGRTVWWRAHVLGGMIGSLFIRSYERGERIYAAMLSRGFGGEVRSLTRLRWQVHDSWVGLGWMLALSGVTLLGRTPFPFPL